MTTTMAGVEAEFGAKFGAEFYSNVFGSVDSAPLGPVGRINGDEDMWSSLRDSKSSATPTGRVGPAEPAEQVSLDPLYERLFSDDPMLQRKAFAYLTPFFQDPDTCVSTTEHMCRDGKMSALVRLLATSKDQYVLVCTLDILVDVSASGERALALIPCQAVAHAAVVLTGHPSLAVSTSAMLLAANMASIPAIRLRMVRHAQAVASAATAATATTATTMDPSWPCGPSGPEGQAALRELCELREAAAWLLAALCREAPEYGPLRCAIQFFVRSFPDGSTEGAASAAQGVDLLLPRFAQELARDGAADWLVRLMTASDDAQLLGCALRALVKFGADAPADALRLTVAILETQSPADTWSVAEAGGLGGGGRCVGADRDRDWDWGGEDATGGTETETETETGTGTETKTGTETETGDCAKMEGVGESGAGRPGPLGGDLDVDMHPASVPAPASTRWADHTEPRNSERHGAGEWAWAPTRTEPKNETKIEIETETEPRTKSRTGLRIETPKAGLAAPKRGRTLRGGPHQISVLRAEGFLALARLLRAPCSQERAVFNQRTLVRVRPQLLRAVRCANTVEQQAACGAVFALIPAFPRQLLAAPGVCAELDEALQGALRSHDELTLTVSLELVLLRRRSGTEVCRELMVMVQDLQHSPVRAVSGLAEKACV
jgi:hypothetical protein